MKKWLMIFALFCAFGVFGEAPKGWFTDYDAALAKAKTEKKPLYVLFTGSDWCPWCIKLHKNVLKKKKFSDFVTEKMIPVYLDFPRKNPLPPAQRQKNTALAQKLQAGSGVPCAVIVDPDGKVIGQISGYDEPDRYIAQLQKFVK